MGTQLIFCLLVAQVLLLSCSSQQALVIKPVMEEKPVAFPGAEGFGKYTTGGRGGKVMIVSNLNDDGYGSLRKAAEANGPRVVIFNVSGTIHLLSKLNIKGNITLAGQTAPGDGICIADYPVSIAGDNVIVRFLRFRMGDRYQNKGMVDGAGSDDAFSASGRKNIIIDHCSMSWSTDEVCSVYKGDSTTLQWNLITEPLNYSYHFETGDRDFEHHGYGGIWGGSHFSAHHNLIAHCVSRTPRFNGVRLGETDELADFTNNVIYNWGHNNVYGGENGKYNLINNYYKYGPETKKNMQSRIVNPTRTANTANPYGRFYVAGNYVDGDDETTADNYLGIHADKATTEQETQMAIVNHAFPVISVRTQPAQEAYKAVLQYAGAILPQRDTLDQRVIKEVANRTGRFIDVQGGYPHGTAYEKTINAWPSLQQEPPLRDTDKDGMPDEWELKNQLNINDPDDASLYSVHQSYTNIEVYINSLVQ